MRVRLGCRVGGWGCGEGEGEGGARVGARARGGTLKSSRRSSALMPRTPRAKTRESSPVDCCVSHAASSDCTCAKASAMKRRRAFCPTGVKVR